MIDDTTWYVGGMTRTNGRDSNANTAYNYEVGANKDTSTYITHYQTCGMPHFCII